MGLSSITFIVVLGFLAILITSGLVLMFSDYSGSDVNMKGREEILERQVKSGISFIDFNCTNTTATTLNVTIYLDNTGNTNLRGDCIDLLIDNIWVNHSDFDSVPRPPAFDRMLWNPSENLQLSTLQTIDVGEHNATVITCGGVRAQGKFNASKCGGGTCHGGEYCRADDLDCDLRCYTTRCEDGCLQQLTAAGGKDSFGLICNETGGCVTGDCVCNGAGTCCGADGSTCIDDSQCCSTCNQGPGTCNAYP